MRSLTSTITGAAISLAFMLSYHEYGLFVWWDELANDRQMVDPNQLLHIFVYALLPPLFQVGLNPTAQTEQQKPMPG